MARPGWRAAPVSSCRCGCSHACSGADSSENCSGCTPAYLSRYTHRVAISNSRLLALDEHGVTFRWKDYRAKGRTRHKAMTLEPAEFMRRFLLHVLPGGLHRIRHYGLLANGCRKASLALARELLHVASAPAAPPDGDFAESAQPSATFICRQCGRPMCIVQIFTRGIAIRAPPS